MNDRRLTLYYHELPLDHRVITANYNIYHPYRRLTVFTARPKTSKTDPSQHHESPGPTQPSPITPSIDAMKLQLSIVTKDPWVRCRAYRLCQDCQTRSMTCASPQGPDPMIRTLTFPGGFETLRGSQTASIKLLELQKLACLGNPRARVTHSDSSATWPQRSLPQTLTLTGLHHCFDSCIIRPV